MTSYGGTHGMKVPVPHKSCPARNAQPKRRSLVSVECLASDLDRLFALLPTFEHQKGIRLFDELARDPANAAPILQELLAVVSNHDDPQLHTPHGMLTVHAGRDLLRLTRPPGGLGLLRFLVLYNFSLWKLYRTLTSRFGYPEFLKLGETASSGPESILAAFESSLRYKSPPAEETVRRALEDDLPLADLLAKTVDFYGNWTVGEKEHTISYLNAVLQTANFLGKDEALLPLAIGLSKLPF